MQLCTGVPSTCTVQAPQSPPSQPFFTPRLPCSRRNVRRHWPGRGSACAGTPLISIAPCLRPLSSRLAFRPVPPGQPALAAARRPEVAGHCAAGACLPGRRVRPGFPRPAGTSCPCARRAGRGCRRGTAPPGWRRPAPRPVRASASAAAEGNRRSCTGRLVAAVTVRTRRAAGVEPSDQQHRRTCPGCSATAGGTPPGRTGPTPAGWTLRRSSPGARAFVPSPVTKSGHRQRAAGAAGAQDGGRAVERRAQRDHGPGRQGRAQVAAHGGHVPDLEGRHEGVAAGADEVQRRASPRPRPRPAGIRVREAHTAARRCRLPPARCPPPTPLGVSSRGAEVQEPPERFLSEGGAAVGEQHGAAGEPGVAVAPCGRIRGADHGLDGVHVHWAS